VEILLPLLVGEGCVFKLARSQLALQELNDGHTAPASVGKAVTVYPDQQRVREFGLRLAATLRGHEGPRVLSDRRVAADAPVYYRYGPFSHRQGRDVRGRPQTRLHGPAGEEFEARAGLSYRQPSWIADPFTERNPRPEIDHAISDPMLGGYYRIVAGIRETALGNVYRAIDVRDCHRVVVKQARAFVAERGDGNDARLRLRNERRILQALDGVAGVPRFIDHFRHGDDEFLVTSDCGPRTLDDDVREDGPYQPGPGSGERRLERLAAELAGILLAVHERGVIMRDLSPANVLVGDGVSIIDFGFSAHDGLHLAGGTPGYAPARQLRDEPPRAADDFHALAMTLLFAATGLHPVTLGDDLELPRTRALQAVSRDYHPAPPGIIVAIMDLLEDEDEDEYERAYTAVRRMASADVSRPSAVQFRPRPPSVTEELAANVTASLVRDLVDRLDRVLEAPDTTQAAHDVSIYSGSAGIGLELLHHDEYPPARKRVGELTAFTARAAAQSSLPPGLFAGATGTNVFLREAALRRGDSVALSPSPRLPSAELRKESPDLIDGIAGVGLGHLYFYRAGHDPADLDLARQCALALSSERPTERTSRPGRADLATGLAHGLAGDAALLLALAAETGDAAMLEAAAARIHSLAERARPLILEATATGAEPMTASWCRGLSGIGQTLLHASTVLDDVSLLDLARRAADACVVRIPRLSALGQCCGAAGVGNYLLNLAVQERSERYWKAAYEVATHLLLRSAGPPARPQFFATHDSPERSLSWGQGLTGILAFFRRLAYGGPDCLQVLW
jgi:serine/threonine protein kinase